MYASLLPGDTAYAFTRQMEFKVQNSEPLNIGKRQMCWIAELHNIQTLTQQNSRLNNISFLKFIKHTELHTENKPFFPFFIFFLHSDPMICLLDILPQTWRIGQNDMRGHGPVSVITKTAITLELLVGFTWNLKHRLWHYL